MPDAEGDFSFTIASDLAVSQAELWQHITNMRNVNDELMPYARMTYPKDRSHIDGREIPLRQTLFTSIILLFGFIPIDLHRLMLDGIEAGTAFYENSATLMHRYWRHTRSLTQNGSLTMIQDEIHFMPRIHFLGYVLLPIYQHIFKHRHQQLRKVFS